MDTTPQGSNILVVNLLMYIIPLFRFVLLLNKNLFFIIRYNNERKRIDDINLEVRRDKINCCIKLLI